MSDPRSRRELLSSLFGVVRSPSRPAAAPAPPDPDRLLRPPGALVPDPDFLGRCTGCGDCSPVCPHGSILFVDREDGRRLPGIQPEARPCHLCPELPCVSACGDEALVDPGGPRAVRLGIARVNPRRCVTFSGQACDRCYRACPFPNQALLLIGLRPLVGTGACTGCGLCEHACPEQPKAIVVIAERHLIPGLRVPEREHDWR